MTHIPICSTKGCPHPTDDDFHRCPVCGKQAVQHHHYPSRAQAGKGAEIVAALCQNHHDKITLHQWREGVYPHPDGSKHYYVQNQKGETMCDVLIEGAPEEAGVATAMEVAGVGPPAETVDNQTAPTLESVPDEQLAALFAEADRRQAEGFLLKCRIVHTYRERHVQAWGASWTESAYELFHISRRTLNAYANLHEILDTSDRYLIEQIAPLTDSRGLMTYIGRKNVEDGGKALEAAVSYLAEFAEAPTVAALQHKLGEEAKPPDVCPESGLGHTWCCVFCGKERT